MPASFRIRRIKCDEGKPFCRQCTRTGRKCDGYTGPNPRKRGAVARAEPAGMQAPPLPTPRGALALIPAREPHETRALQLYCQRIVHIVHPMGDFGRLVASLSMMDPLMRETTIAMAIVFESASFGPHNAHDSSKFPAHRVRVLSGIRGRLAPLTSPGGDGRSLNDWRALLMVIVQSIGMELLRGDLGVVRCHIEGMRQIIRLYGLEDLDYVSSPVGPQLTSTFSELVRRLSVTLAMYAVHDALASGAADPSAGASSHSPGDALVAGQLPLHFASNWQVTETWYAVLSDYLELVHWLETTPVEDAVRRAAIDQTLARLQSWRAALDAYAPLALASGPQPYVWTPWQATVYHVHVCAMALRLKALGLGEDERHYDGFGAEFGFIVRSAMALPPDAASQTSSMWCHRSTALSLYLVALKCRDPDLRRQAVDWMEARVSWPRLYWHRRAFQVARRAIEIEEEGRRDVRSAADVPESARIRGVRMLWGLSDQSVKLRYWAWTADGGLSLREETL